MRRMQADATREITLSDGSTVVYQWADRGLWVDGKPKDVAAAVYGGLVKCIAIEMLGRPLADLAVRGGAAFIDQTQQAACSVLGLDPLPAFTPKEIADLQKEGREGVARAAKDAREGYRAVYGVLPADVREQFRAELAQSVVDNGKNEDMRLVARAFSKVTGDTLEFNHARRGGTILAGVGSVPPPHAGKGGLSTQVSV